MSQYFSESYEPSGGNVKMKLNLSDYATKAELKGATGFGISMLASKTDLAGLKIKVDNLDEDKLKTVPSDLSTLSIVVDNDVIKLQNDKFVIKGNASDTKIPSTSGLLIETQYDSDKESLVKKTEDVEKKIQNTSGLFKKTEIENKTISVTSLVTTVALNTKATEIRENTFY